MKSFISRLRARISASWKARSLTSRVLLVCLPVILIAIGVSLCRSFRATPKAIERRLYGEEIGRNGLRYKHGAHIYNPETGKILVDSIEWLHIAPGDTIAILAENHRRAFINLNTAELITPLDFDKAWQFACDRGIMSRHDSLFIFRSDGAGSDELYRDAGDNEHGIVRHPRRHDHHDHDEDGGDVSGKKRRCLVTFGKAFLTTKQITRVCVRALFVVNRVGCYFTS